MMGHKTPYKAIVAFVVLLILFRFILFISHHILPHLVYTYDTMMIYRNVMDFPLPRASLSTVFVMMPCRAASAEQRMGYIVKDG